jgi:ribosomal protein S18 acetylase RimI-like enzyme
VLDLYVRPEARGRAVALRLLAAAAAQLRREGGAFLRGTAVGTGAAKQLYDRVAICNPTTECTVSGRGFRELADLENASRRDLVQRLPNADSNYEA